MQSRTFSAVAAGLRGAFRPAVSRPAVSRPAVSRPAVSRVAVKPARTAAKSARTAATSAAAAAVVGAFVFGAAGCGGSGGADSGAAAPSAGGPGAATGTAAVAPHPRGARQLAISEAWIRLLPGDSPSGGYFVIHNDSAVNRTIVGAEAEDFQAVMLHQSVEQNGLSTMVHVDKVVVPAHGDVSFEPGGYHLMLMGPKRPLNPGDSERVTLHFADTTQLPVAFELRNAAGTEAK